MRFADSSEVAVVALHCSGATGGMWQTLRETLGGGARFLAPNLYGAPDGPVWMGERAFTLADEAAPVIELIDAEAHPVHLVGHSYGGALALDVALARADRIASLTLYEPASFHLLKPADGIEYAEILWLARDAEAMLARGDAQGAMRRFTDYWGGQGCWDALTPAAQAARRHWAPKVTLDFHALLDRPGQSAAYEQLGMPVRIITGDRSPAPTREIADILCGTLPDCRQAVLGGAGHLGPITHAADVAAEIAGHIGSLAQGSGDSFASIAYENGRAA